MHKTYLLVLIGCYEALHDMIFRCLVLHLRGLRVAVRRQRKENSLTMVGHSFSRS
jgi:hypothetical protein